MNHFLQIAAGLDITSLRKQVLEQPELWGRNPARTERANSPHAQTQDIWLRFRHPDELTAPKAYTEPHFAEFYPAWYSLPALHPLVFDLMRQIGAVYIGGILITKIPAGCAVLPHQDSGWHPEFLETKIYLPIQGNPDCVNACENERVSMQPGDAWIFDNLKTHSVENNGTTDRITAILCCRTR